MCGICGGMSYPLNMAELGHVKTLMVLSSLRGYEGSGAISVREQKRKLYVPTVKSELSSAELAVDPDFEEIIHGSKIVIAHSRAPTRGGNEPDFVHPHRSGHITGVHNGTMFEIGGQRIDDKVSDSKKIFEFLSEHTVEDFIKSSRGAYSLVWVDTKLGTLNFLRNDQRPMIWARICGGTDHASTMFWASEKSMLDYALVTRGQYVSASIKYIIPAPWEHISFPLDVKDGIFPKEVKKYENPTNTPAYVKFHGGKWLTKSEWEKELEKISNRQDKIERQGESEIPLLPPPRPPFHAPSAMHSTTYGPREFRRGGHTGTNDWDRDARFLPKVDDILARRTGTGGDSNSVLPFPVREVGPKLAEQLVRRGGCVICEEKPRIFSEIKGGETEEVTLTPKIHPIKFAKNAGFLQYICDDCVQSKNPLAITLLGAAALAGPTKH